MSIKLLFIAIYASVAQSVLLGTAWYPEQWAEWVWERDLELMNKANVEVVRIAEFAWSSMEPSEGKYNFTWLDNAISAASRYNISVVLGTPTAAPPVWLTSNYPETLRVEEDGKRVEHGNRQHFSFSSDTYRKYCRTIASIMAERYGENPNVIGWQIDNEFAYDSFDDESCDQFHAWLEDRYGTIENLNAKWGTTYWSITYQSFDQVAAKASGQSPALMLAWRRFATDTWVSYASNQVDVIRKYAKNQWITSNTMGWFDDFDEYKLNEVFDLVSWDDYVAGGSDVYDWVDNAARHDLTRGYKHQNFWVMETAPGFANWQPVNCVMRKGIVRNMAWQAVGHGADAILYWQWRSAPNGHEVYHGTLVGADSEPVPMYDEILQLGREFVETADALDGTEPVAEVALINDFDSRWAINFQRHSSDFDPINVFKSFYRPIREIAQTVDVVSAVSPLNKYKVVIAPSLNVLTEKVAKHLASYVEKGGHLVLGPRSGMKNIDNGLNTQRQPGPLIDLVGAQIEQFYALAGEIPIEGGGSARVWAEQVKVLEDDVETVLTFGESNGWLDGKPAVISRAVGDGRISYVAGWLDDKSLDDLANKWLKSSGEAPTDVEVCVRESDSKRVTILISHSERETREVKVGSEIHEVGPLDVKIIIEKSETSHDTEQSVFGL